MRLYLTITDTATGAMLAQLSEEEKKPIYYLSRKLLDSELNYSVLEKSCAALVWTEAQTLHALPFGQTYFLHESP